MNRLGEDSFSQKVIQIIQKIPQGSVTTYGTVALLAGFPRRARVVGYILHSMTEKYQLPWQRVINRNGYLSIRGAQMDSKSLQRALLEQEGVAVSKDFMIDLKKYGWWGPS